MQNGSWREIPPCIFCWREISPERHDPHLTGAYFFRWDEEKSLTNSGVIKWDPMFFGGDIKLHGKSYGKFQGFRTYKSA